MIPYPPPAVKSSRRPGGSGPFPDFQAEELSCPARSSSRPAGWDQAVAGHRPGVPDVEPAGAITGEDQVLPLTAWKRPCTACLSGLAVSSMAAPLAAPSD